MLKRKIHTPSHQIKYEKSHHANNNKLHLHYNSPVGGEMTSHHSYIHLRCRCNVFMCGKGPGHVFTQLYLMTALLQHSALNSRALAASDKHSKSNRPVFALRLPDRPVARHRSTLTGLCHPKTLSVYHCKSLENKIRREQIEVNEWYSGERNDGLIKGPGHHVRWRLDWRMVLLANTLACYVYSLKASAG